MDKLVCSKEAGPYSIWRAIHNKPSLDLTPHLQYNIKRVRLACVRLCGMAVLCLCRLGQRTTPCPFAFCQFSCLSWHIHHPDPEYHIPTLSPRQRTVPLSPDFYTIFRTTSQCSKRISYRMEQFISRKLISNIYFPSWYDSLSDTHHELSKFILGVNSL